jgi:hypothetical protein
VATLVDLISTIPGSGHETSPTVEGVDKVATGDNDQVCEGVTCPTLSPHVAADHQGSTAPGKTKDKVAPPKVTNADAKKVRKDRKSKKPKTTEEESCPVSIGGAVEGLLEACTVRTDAALSRPPASPTTNKRQLRPTIKVDVVGGAGEEETGKVSTEA